VPLNVSLFRYMDSLPENNIDLASSAMAGMNSEGSDKESTEDIIAKIYGVEKDQVLLTPSGTFASFFVINYLKSKIMKIVTIAPEYPVFSYQAEEAGIKVIIDNRITNDGIDLSPWDVEENAAYFISNPNNPTGLMWSEESVRSIARETESNESFLIVDDTFSFFSTSFPKKIEIGNAITVSSVSKFFGDSGIKMGWIIARKEIIEEMKEKMDFVVPKISSIVRKRGSYLLNNTGVYRDYNIKKLEQNSKILFEELDEYILGAKGSVVNALTVGSESLKFSLSLIKEGVSTVPGYFFGSDSIIRLGIGTEEHERVERGVKSISKMLKEKK
jgi:aspartate/methionine/tyrosine aminotransferase